MTEVRQKILKPYENCQYTKTKDSLSFFEYVSMLLMSIQCLYIYVWYLTSIGRLDPMDPYVRYLTMVSTYEETLHLEAILNYGNENSVTILYC
jgi:hypothetical protein